MRNSTMGRGHPVALLFCLLSILAVDAARYGRYRYTYTNYRSYSYYRSYSSTAYRAPYRSSSTYTYARTYSRGSVSVRASRVYSSSANSVYNYYYYNMYYYSAGALVLGDSHYRETKAYSVCENYEQLQNPNASSSTVLVLGRFTCPLEFEPSDYKYCCGQSMAEYCCPFFANQGNLAGVIIGIILGLVLLVVGMVILVRVCMTKFRKRRARRRWKVVGAASRIALGLKGSGGSKGAFGWPSAKVQPQRAPPMRYVPRQVTGFGQYAPPPNLYGGAPSGYAAPPPPQYAAPGTSHT